MIWHQQALTAPTLVTARLDLGWNADELVGMWALSVHEGTDHSLIASIVHPFGSAPTLQHLLSTAQTAQRDHLLEAIGAGPFDGV